MHSLPHGVEPPEGEAEVGDAPAHLGPGAHDLDLLDRVQEVNAVVVVLRHTRCNCQDIWIEDDVVAVEPDHVDQDVVRPVDRGVLRDAQLSLNFSSGK